MEKFNADEKMSVLMKLDPREIVIVCDTSKKMLQTCTNSKYNIMWEQKIKEDFNVTGYKGYEDYKFLKKLHEQKIYVVNVIDHNDPGNSYSSLFLTRENAIRYIQSSSGISYSAIITSLNAQYYVDDGSRAYELVADKIEPVEYNKNYDNQKREYERDEEILKSLDKNSYDAINNLIAKLAEEELSINDAEDRISEEFDNLNLGEEKRELIEKIIYKRLIL